ncbi:MAG: desulfoferrodoxin [Thermoguttaceae bacterium]|nr:desulfoferrodoxin [Thermoguttaceae bacterium]MBP3693406.1 desulfoferrodoxin [Thermoguttaceae bacterium]
MKKFEIYRCPVCGNMVEALNDGFGKLMCCGKPMEKLEENSTDAAGEKHVPVLSRGEYGVKVSVGSVAHPMTDEHFIGFIEVHSEDRMQRKYLRPGELPEAEFSCPPSGCLFNIQPSVRAYCNLHGLWEAK